MDIADKIRLLRCNKLKLGQEAFAKKLNVSRKTITNWESGASKPTTTHIMMIGIACDVTTDFLIFEDHPFELSLHDIGDVEYRLLQEVISYYRLKNHAATISNKKNT